MQIFVKKFITPLSKNEDTARKEFILNVLLSTIIILSFVVFVINLIKSALSIHVAVSAWTILIPLSFFIFLYYLSRRGYVFISSFLLLTAFFIPVSYMIYKWGVDIPMAILAYALIIFIAGILISTRFAFVFTILICSTIASLAYLQILEIIKADRYWIYEQWGIADITAASFIFFIIATVSWLSNREIEKSLARARRSEAELKKERDSLEVTVEKRTRELKETQAEKMTQLYRFAEFGRLSSGLFHDLINPLNAVSLNLERAQVLRDKPAEKEYGEAKACTERAVRAAHKLEDMVSAVRKQLAREENKTFFSVNNEIAQALEVLSHKAQKSGVVLRFFSRQEIKTYGDAVKFNQIALNLVANAIDSYLEKGKSDARIVTLSLSQENDRVVFEARDKGVGISEENKGRLFEPFFTTKKEGYGLGIGLSMVKRIVEKDFGGSIEVESKESEGSVFTVKFPIKNAS